MMILLDVFYLHPEISIYFRHRCRNTQLKNESPLLQTEVVVKRRISYFFQAVRQINRLDFTAVKSMILDYSGFL